MSYELVIALIKPVAKEIYNLIFKLAKAKKKSILINSGNIEDAIVQHLNKVNRFTSQISFRELNQPKSISSIYIPLDLSIHQSEKKELNDDLLNQDHIKPQESRRASEVIENVILNTTNNVILKGLPGAGKTTTLKFICQQLFINENFLGKDIHFPILIRFREDEILNNPEIPLFEYILNVFGIIIENSNNLKSEIEEIKQLNLFKKQAAIKIVDQQFCLLVLDGIDEVPNEVIKNTILKNINELSLTTTRARFILTTRKGDDLFHIENTQSFELSPLNDEQIKGYTIRWLKEDKALDFIKQLKNSSVYDTAKRPLTLSHLCAIFEKEGKIPDRSRSIYKKIVNLLILDWNIENQINRPSKFTSFDPDRKKEFLENLSFELSVTYNKNQFSSSDLAKCYQNLYNKYDLPLFQMSDVINEIQIHNGLITQIGYDQFEFAHKSFQEYLAAEYLVKLPRLPANHYLLRIPSEMALAVTLSSEPSEYLSYFIDECLIKEECDFNFLLSFFTRIGIEKPDFIELNTVGLSILTLHNKYCSFSKNSTNKKYNSEEMISLLSEMFSILLNFENLKLSILSTISHLNIDIEDIKRKDGFLELNFSKPSYSEIMSKKAFIVTKEFYLKIMA